MAQENPLFRVVFNKPYWPRNPYAQAAVGHGSITFFFRPNRVGATRIDVELPTDTIMAVLPGSEEDETIYKFSDKLRFKVHRGRKDVTIIEKFISIKANCDPPVFEELLRVLTEATEWTRQVRAVREQLRPSQLPTREPVGDPQQVAAPTAAPPDAAAEDPQGGRRQSGSLSRRHRRKTLKHKKRRS